MPRRDVLVVGAGLTGATMARALADGGRSVLVVERRTHVAGNAYDERDAGGCLVHRFGPHLFHTNSAAVMAFLSRFTAWYGYEHRVEAQIDGAMVPVPCNLKTMELVFGSSAALRIKAALEREFPGEANIPILRLRTSVDPDVRGLADWVYHRMFLHYTRKQWALEPEALDPSVTGRVPVRVSEDPRYFQDAHQVLPTLGYTAMVQRMLDHPQIEVALGADHREALAQGVYHRVVFTGPIDAFFGYRLGALPYRSVGFEFSRVAGWNIQRVATVNFPNEHDYTRMTDCSHFAPARGDSSVIITEYPQAYEPTRNEPYYPIPRQENSAMYRRYREMAAIEAPLVVFAGRLAEYQYFNMDQAVGRGLMLAGRMMEQW